MKKTMIIFFATIAFVGCQKETAPTETFKQVPTADEAKNTTEVPVLKSNAPVDPAKLMNSWTGMFGPNKITVIVDEVKGSQVKGRSVVAGNDRPFTGTVSQDQEGCHFEVKEPGDNPYDGAFSFLTHCDTPTRIDGQWNPFKKGLTAKTFRLTQRTFSYDKNAGDYPQASQRALTENELMEMPPDVLRIMRNEMYARHGYNFKIKDMRAHFDNQDWYMPMHHDVRGTLTALEKKNETLIKRYEKYNADYYDNFGR